MKPGTKPWSAPNEFILRKLLGKDSLEAIAALVGRTPAQVHKKAIQLGLRARRRRRAGWTSAQDAELVTRFPHEPTAWIARDLGRSCTSVSARARKLDLAKTAEYLASPAACRLRRGDNVGAAHRFKPGQVPKNKGVRRPGWAPGRMAQTQFKKGSLSGRAAQNVQPIGATRISKDGYLERKINNDLPMQRRWRAEHLLLWERERGPLPAGHCLAFKNGNKADIRLDNLECISRAERMQRNTIHNLAPPIKEALYLVGRVTKAIRKRRRDEKQD